jgi:hypothetical protein
VKFTTQLALLMVLYLMFASTCYCLEPTPTPTQTLLPTASRTPITGDLNCDGIVRVEDQLLLLRNWHKVAQPATREIDVITVTLSGLPASARPLRLKHIPAGSFQMGSRKYPANEDPRHQVTINYSFYLGETEITQAQWKAVMGSNPSVDLGFTAYGVGDNYPVYYVSWEDCQAFVIALNALNQGAFRLPSEAEWEYACRGPESNPFRNDVFSFGDELTVTNLSACGFGPLFDQYMWWCGNCPWPAGCHPAATKTPQRLWLV